MTFPATLNQSVPPEPPDPPDSLRDHRCVCTIAHLPPSQISLPASATMKLFPVLSFFFSLAVLIETLAGRESRSSKGRELPPRSPGLIPAPPTVNSPASSVPVLAGIPLATSGITLNLANFITRYKYMGLAHLSYCGHKWCLLGKIIQSPKPICDSSCSLLAENNIWMRVCLLLCTHLISSSIIRLRAKISISELDIISPITVQNLCLKFLRKDNSLAVFVTPLELLRATSSVSNYHRLSLPPVRREIHFPIHRTNLHRNGFTNLHLSFTVQFSTANTVISTSPFTTTELRSAVTFDLDSNLRKRNRLSSVILMGLVSPFSIIKLNRNKITMDLFYQSRQSRSFPMDVTHGSRASMLMPDNIPLLSKLVFYRRFSTPSIGCINVGIKSDYLMLFRATGLGIQVKILHGFLHEAEQASILNDSIFRFIVMFVLIVSPLSWSPVVSKSSMSI